MVADSLLPETGFQVPPEQALRKSIRRLRWFKSTFEEQVEAASVRTGTDFSIDTRILAECFVEWVRIFEATKPSNPDERHDYVGFAAGRMLKELIVRGPLAVTEISGTEDKTLPEYFWPQGFVYVSYCLNVRQSVLAQDFDEHVKPAPEFYDIRTWWSFKENVEEMPDNAIPFLDLFAGKVPDWSSPGLFTPGKQRNLVRSQPRQRLGH